MRCDDGDDSTHWFSNWFQSLLGFLMRCDSKNEFLISYVFEVSIPAGFSNALRPGGPSSSRHFIQVVSIPAGFSNALRLDVAESVASADAFQSLLGFLMRCDKTFTIRADTLETFQSLLGFLMRCDTINPVKRNMLNCFNPCWVF